MRFEERMGAVQHYDMSARRNKRRIVHLTTVHNVRDPRILRKELVTLKEAGYNTHLVASSEESGEIKGISLTALPKVSSRYLRLFLQYKAYREARNLDADCYHFHDPELIPLCYALKCTTNARLIYDMHEDYWWHGPIEGRCIRALERWCFRWIDHVVVANSNHMGITKSSGVSAAHIPNYYKKVKDCASPSVPRQLPKTGPMRVIYTGVMNDQGGRGLSNLIDLAHHLKHRRLEGQLDLIGVCYVDRIRDKIEKRLRREGLEAVVRRVGWDRYVEWERLVKYYIQAHVGVMLGTEKINKMRIIPTKFYEYMNYGLPIICSDFPLWRQFIEKHQCGEVVPLGNPSAAWEVLDRWHRHPSQYRKRSEAALQAASQYRWEDVGKRLVNLYDDLLL